MGARLTVKDMRRLMRQAGIKDASGEAARRVRRFLEDHGVLVPTGSGTYELGPLAEFQPGHDATVGPADIAVLGGKNFL